jgi:transglutaminase-like putative cysteine protease
MRRAAVLEAGVALLALLTGWVALFAWRGLVEAPEQFLGPTLVGGILLALAGAVARTRRVRWYGALGIQLVVLALFVNVQLASSRSWLGIVPTRSSLDRVGTLVAAGAESLGTQYSPVPADFPGVHDTLMLSALGLLLLIDVLACGLGRVPVAGLPLLVIWMIPISLLSTGLSWLLFVVTALLFVMLLATEQTRRVLAWGRSVAGRGKRYDSFDQLVSGASVRSSAARIGLVSCGIALVVPLFVPLAHHSFGGEGPGPGDGQGRSITIQNPLVDLRRDLVRPDEFPMLTVRTDADPSYLRLTVLDTFSGASWRPSARVLPPDQRADGPLPDPPGLLSTVPGRTSDWQLSLMDTFSTVWLPTPYPLRSISVPEGDWRYDVRTLDFADAHGDAFHGDLDYRLTSFRPDITAVALDDAFLPPSSVRDAMTVLPTNLPDVIARTAEEIAGDEPTNYQKALALQDWFRDSGGFTYSLERAPGSGMEALAEFVTTDKVGYCEQFAAAMAVMARTLDIPARVVVGFLTPDPIGPDTYLFTSDDLHAWPELFFSGIGWVRFEPTPSDRTGAAPSWTTEALTTAAPNPTPGAQESTAPKQDRADRQPGSADTGDAGSGAPDLLPWLGGALVLLLLAAPRLVRDAQRRSRLAAGTDPQSVAAGVWAELHATAIDLGISWRPERSARQTGRALVRRLRSRPELQRSLEELVQFVERARYGRPFEVDPERARQLHTTVREWSAALAGSVPPGRARWARVFPRSVWRRPQTPSGGGPGGRPEARRSSDELVGAGQ